MFAFLLIIYSHLFHYNFKIKLKEICWETLRRIKFNKTQTMNKFSIFSYFLKSYFQFTACSID